MADSWVFAVIKKRGLHLTLPANPCVHILQSGCQWWLTSNQNVIASSKEGGKTPRSAFNCSWCGNQEIDGGLSWISAKCLSLPACLLHRGHPITAGISTMGDFGIIISLDNVYLHILMHYSAACFLCFDIEGRVFLFVIRNCKHYDPFGLPCASPGQAPILQPGWQ